MGAKEEFSKAKNEKIDKEGYKTIKKFEKNSFAVIFIRIHDQAYLNGHQNHGKNIAPAKG